MDSPIRETTKTFLRDYRFYYAILVLTFLFVLLVFLFLALYIKPTIKGVDGDPGPIGDIGHQGRDANDVNQPSNVTNYFSFNMVGVSTPYLRVKLKVVVHDVKLENGSIVKIKSVERGKSFKSEPGHLYISSEVGTTDSTGEPFNTVVNLNKSTHDVSTDRFPVNLSFLNRSGRTVDVQFRQSHNKTISHQWGIFVVEELDRMTIDKNAPTQNMLCMAKIRDDLPIFYSEATPFLDLFVGFDITFHSPQK